MVDFHVSELQQVHCQLPSSKSVGRIDSMNADELGEALTGEIERGGRQIVLDLSKVSYMSSAGLRELVAAYQQAAERLRRPAPGAAVVARAGRLEMSGLDTIFQIFPTQTEAVGSY